MARILIADDAEVSRGAIGAVLECFGHEIVEARSGAECLETLSEMICDLLITDLDMPQASRVEMIATMKSHAPTLPVILISGFDFADDTELLQQAASIGVDGILRKPFRAKELLSSVELALKGCGVFSGQTETEPA